MGSCITKDNYYSPVFTYIPPKNNSSISFITYASCTSIGYRHMKSENQDRGGVSLNPGGGGTRFVAFVFDGHGEFGSAVVEYALEEFPEILHKHIQLSTVRPQLYLPQKEGMDYSSLSQKYTTGESSSCRLSSKINNSTQILPINNNNNNNNNNNLLQNPSTNISVLPVSSTSSSCMNRIENNNNIKNKKVEKTISFDSRNRSNSSNNNNNNLQHNHHQNLHNNNNSKLSHKNNNSKKSILNDYETASGEHIKYKESHRYLSLDRVLHQSSGKYLRNTALETNSNGRNNNNNNFNNNTKLSPSGSVSNMNTIHNNNNNNKNNMSYNYNNIIGNNDSLYNLSNSNLNTCNAIINGDILCEIMKHSFLDLHNNMIENSSEVCSLEMSGCTATSIIIEGNTLICSNVGDSRGLLCRRNNENKYFGIQITTDHRVSVPKERARIEECGGCVFKAPHKGMKGEDRMWVKDCLYPGLMVSRSLGDTIAHEIGNITMPDTIKMELTVNDDMIILGSDGIWDVLDNDRVIDIINNLKSVNGNADASAYCKELLKNSLEGWKELNASDNIYITVIMLHHNPLI